jgi:hypothetical protein
MPVNGKGSRQILLIGLSYGCGVRAPRIASSGFFRCFSERPTLDRNETLVANCQMNLAGGS